MATTNLNNVRQEIIVYLRKKLTDPQNRGTARTDNFTGTGAATQFTLAQTNVKHITSLTVAGVSQREFFDYNVEYTGATKGRITFTSAPANGAAIVVNYRYGDTWVFSEFPKKRRVIGDYPLIVASFVKRTQPLGIGGTTYLSDFLITVTIRGADAWQITNFANDLQTALIADAKAFYYLPFVKCDGISDVQIVEDRETSINEVIVYIASPFKLEN